MTNARHRTPRRSILEGRHPAIPQGPAPVSPASPETDPLPATPARATTEPFAPRDRRQKMTINVSSALVDQAKDAFWVARGEYRSFSAWVEDALRRHIDTTRAAHDLDELPPRPHVELPTGRPIS